jgi:predicted Fe-Mo cluster-binding NifX family protein
MKIAIPSTEESILCPHFGHAPCFAIIEIETTQKTILNVEIMQPEQGGHEGIPPWLKSMNVTALIAGGLGKMAIDNLQKHDIEVFYGAPELPVKEIAQLWMNDNLNLNPQPCNHTHDHNCEHSH